MTGMLPLVPQRAPPMAMQGLTPRGGGVPETQAAHSPKRPPPNQLRSPRRNGEDPAPFSRPLLPVADEEQNSPVKVWSAMGCLVHTLRAEEVQGLNAQYREAIRHERSKVGKKRSKNKPVAKLDLDKIQNYESSAPHAATSRTARLGQDTAARAKELLRSEEATGVTAQQVLAEESLFHPDMLRGAMTDRVIRSEWLRRTHPLSDRGVLERFPLRKRKTPVVDKLSPEEIRDTEEQVRSNTHALNVVLQTINASCRAGTMASVEMPQRVRQQRMQGAQDELRAMRSNITAMQFSLGHLNNTRLARFDFVEANRKGLQLASLDVKGSRGIRQAVLGAEQQDAALYLRAKKDVDRCAFITHVLERREVRVEKTRQTEEVNKTEQRERLWLAAICLGQVMPVWFTAAKVMKLKRERSAQKIANVYRLYFYQRGMKRMASLLVITRRLQKPLERWRRTIRDRAVVAIKTFVHETRSLILVLPAIRNFKRKVLLVQKGIRAFLKRWRAGLIRNNAHFEKIERQVVIGMLRERHDREKSLTSLKSVTSVKEAQTGEAKRRHRIVQDLDCVALANDPSVMKIPEFIRTAMVKMLAKKLQNDHYYAMIEWKRMVKEFRISFRKITLFRVTMEDFLGATGQEEVRVNELERKVGKGKVVSRILEEMNKKLPIKPTFSEHPSEERMKALVMQSLFTASANNAYLQILLTDVAKPEEIVQEPAWMKLQNKWRAQEGSRKGSLEGGSSFQTAVRMALDTAAKAESKVDLLADATVSIQVDVTEHKFETAEESM